MARRAPSAHPRDILRKRGLYASRRLGQSFLVSAEAMGKVVEAARLGPEDVVLEIGTGLGRLTQLLAAGAAAVVSVEIDAGLYQVAVERLAGRDNVTLLHCDFLAGKHKINPGVTEAVQQTAGGRPVKVVSNLPYQISSPAMVNLLQWEAPLAELDVMLQVEVAQRLTALPGTGEYGPVTVLASHRARTEILFRIPPSAFWPMPAVSSCFVRLTPDPQLPQARSYACFAEVVNKLFQNRRKTLSRALRIGWGRETAERTLAACRLDPNLRADNIPVAGFIRIADALACGG